MPPDQEQLTITPPVLGFDGKRASFMKVLVINGILTILTLGIYRFWAKTKVRRFFWSNIRFLDDPLEYTGTGGELFVGFLIVMAILFPLGLIYSAIGALAPPDIPAIQIGLEVVYYLVIYALIQIGFYRMWRYRMSRTTWRGVRFGLDGSTWTYLKLAIGWTLLSTITLGLAYPWMQIDLWRYQVRHTRIGSEIFKFEGNAKDLIWPWMIVYIPLLCIVGASFGIWASVDSISEQGIPNIPHDKMNNVQTMGTIISLAYLIFIVAFFEFKLRQTRFQISGLRLDIASFKSTLPVARLVVFAGLSIVIIIIVFLGFGLLLPALIQGVSLSTGMEQLPKLLGVPFAITGFIMLIVGIPLIWSVLFKFEVIKQMVITTTIDNPETLEQAAQSISEGPRTGEGLADALDIGGF